MTETIRGYVRRKHILTTLKDYGPLSFRTLLSMIEPPIKERRLHESIGRLVKRGLVTKRFERIFRGQATLYQLHQSPLAVRAIAEILGCKTDDIRQHYYQRRDLLHTEYCSLWAHELRKTFPTATVTRDFELKRETPEVEVLIWLDDEDQLKPDLLLLYQPEGSQIKIWIAFEIERTSKKPERIVQKLKKYAYGTHVDGVVYVCGSDRIESLVNHTYNSKVIEKAYRIRPYVNNFLLFSSDLENPKLATENLHNSKLESFSLREWMDYLIALKSPQRQNTRPLLQHSPASQPPGRSTLPL